MQREIRVSDNQGKWQVVREDVSRIKEAASALSAAVSSFLGSRTLQLVSDPKIKQEINWWGEQLKSKQADLVAAFMGE